MLGTALRPRVAARILYTTRRLVFHSNRSPIARIFDLDVCARSARFDHRPCYNGPVSGRPMKCQPGYWSAKTGTDRSLGIDMGKNARA